jgi:hypothetical protein
VRQERFGASYLKGAERRLSGGKMSAGHLFEREANFPALGRDPPQVASGSEVMREALCAPGKCYKLPLIRTLHRQEIGT